MDTWMGHCDMCGDDGVVRELAEFDQYALCVQCRAGHAADLIAKTEMPSGCGRACEGTVNGKPCKARAVAYGGWPGAGGWAGAYCQQHVDLMVPSGFQVWDRLEVPA